MSRLLFDPLYPLSKSCGNWQPIVNRSVVHDMKSNGTVCLAVGEDCSISYTTDGLTWTCVNTQVIPAGTTLNKVLWTGVFWVVCGTQNVIAKSTDGLTWTLVTSPIPLDTTANFAAMLWDGTHVCFIPVVAVNPVNIYYTSDFVTWQIRVSPIQIDASVTAFYLSGYYYVSSIQCNWFWFNSLSGTTHSGGTALYSGNSTVACNTDIGVWASNSYANATNYWLPGGGGYATAALVGSGSFHVKNVFSVSLGFIAVTDGGTLYSSDGKTWNIQSTLNDNPDVLIFACPHGALTLGVLTGNVFARSTNNGATWTFKKEAPPFTAIRGPAVNVTLSGAQGSLFSLGAGYLAVSNDDNITWHTGSFPTGSAVSTGTTPVVSCGGSTVAYAATNTHSFLYSTDLGHTWTSSSGYPQIASASIASSGYGGTTIVVGNAGYIATTSNLVSWTVTQYPTSTDTHLSASWNGSQFYVTSSSSNCSYSSDGVTWQTQSISSVMLKALYHIWTGSQYVITGLDFAWCVTSTTGKVGSFSVQNTGLKSSGGQAIALASNDRGSVLMMNTTSISVSKDYGSTWSSVSLPISDTAAILGSVCWNGTRFYVGTSIGNFQFRMFSYDGVTWTLDNTAYTSMVTAKLDVDCTSLIAVAPYSVLSSSDYGATWIPYYTPFDSIVDVCYGGGTYAVIYPNLVSNKLNWKDGSQLGTGGVTTFHNIEYDGSGTFYMSGGSGYDIRTTARPSGAWYTPGVGTWNSSGVTVGSGSSRVKFLNGRWVNNYLSFAGGTTNTSNLIIEGSATASVPFDYSTYQYLISDFEYGNGVHVAVSNSHAAGPSSYGLAVSTDNALTWSYPTSIPVTACYDRVTYSPTGLFVAVGNGASCYRYDGSFWKTTFFGTSSPSVGLVWDGASFISVHANGSTNRLVPPSS